MAVRPPSIEPAIWSQLSGPTQNAIANGIGLAAGQRNEVQQRAFARVRELRQQGGGGGAPSGGGGGGGAGGGGGGGGGGFGGGGQGGGGGIDLRQLLGTTSSTEVQNNPALLERLLRAAGFSGSMDEMMRQLDLGYSFAGVEQFRRNQAGEHGFAENDPAFQNVSMQSILSDPSSMSRVVGEMMGALERGEDVQALWAQRQAQVPDWAPAVYDELRAGGAPWSTELFGDPGINYRDPTQPLFAPGSSPHSLSQLTGLQAGEEGFYAGLSAAELMSQIYPHYSAYYNRPAGAPAPFAGFTFGSADPTQGQVNPVRESDLYQRWVALGQPGDPSMNGAILGLEGSWYNPLLGTGSPGAPEGPGSGLAQAIASGQLTPGMFENATYNSDIFTGTLGLLGAAVLGGDPSIFFGTGDRAAYNPQNLDAATIQRLLAVMGLVPTRPELA